MASFDIVSAGERREGGYLGLWFDGHKDVGQQRLRTHGAVEGDDSSEEGPKHHDDVYVSVQKQGNRGKMLLGCRREHCITILDLTRL